MSHRLAVFFDLDGTLVDLNPATTELAQLRKAVLQLAATAGISPESPSILGTYQQVVRECGFHHAVAESIRLALDAYEARWAQTRSVVKYDIQDLQVLRQKDYVLAIVTSNGMACLQALFHTKKLRAEWFDFVVTRDDSPLLKPSPMPLERVWYLARQRFPSLSKIRFVGDSKHDRDAAEAFKRSTTFDFTFTQISPTLQSGEPMLSYPRLGDFLQELLTEQVHPLDSQPHAPVPHA
jgi:phosphoglycolate phosphatase-like HAD superfamily hydrolase